MEPTDAFGSAFAADDLDGDSMVQAVRSSLLYLSRLPREETFSYGTETYTVDEVKRSMELFLQVWKFRNRPETFAKLLEDSFDFYASPANEEGEGMLFTGYFEPVLNASSFRDGKHVHPAYAPPEDLRVLDLEKFRPNLANRTIVYRLDGERVLPYHSREEIMADDALAEKALPLVWFANPLDLFFLQIQGSGIVQTERGERFRLGYAGANGRPYSSIGKLLIEEGKIAREAVSMQSIRAYLEAHPEELERVLYANESYTFFQKQKPEKGPLGSINVPLTADRSIATDYLLFPKGGLAFVETEVVRCDATGSCVQDKPVGRFVVNQDTGGAIRGFARADIFMGRGEAAGNRAGRQQSRGKIWFLVAKKSVLLSRNLN